MDLTGSSQCFEGLGWELPKRAVWTAFLVRSLACVSCPESPFKFCRGYLCLEWGLGLCPGGHWQTDLHVLQCQLYLTVPREDAKVSCCPPGGAAAIISFPPCASCNTPGTGVARALCSPLFRVLCPYSLDHPKKVRSKNSYHLRLPPPPPCDS